MSEVRMFGHHQRTIGALLIGVLLWLIPSAAGAHASLTATDPAEGAVLVTAPTTVTLTFNEPVSLGDAGIRLFDDVGTETPLEAHAIDTTIQATLPAGLADGSYLVSWRVISADGHPISGALSFAIGEASTSAIDAPDLGDDPAVTRLLSIVQGIGYVGLLTIAGMVLFHLLILRADPWLQEGPLASPRLRITLAVITIVAYLASVPLTVARQQGMAIGDLTDVARWWRDLPTDVATSVAIVIAGVLLTTIVAPRLPNARLQQVVALIGSGGGLAALSIIGHTRIMHPTWLIVTSNILHTIAGATWIGGVIGLAIVLRSVAATDGARAARIVARFSLLAGIPVGMLAITGVISGWMILQSISALVDTNYGRLLIVKVGLALLVCLLAAANHFRLVPAIRTTPDAADQWQRLRRSILGEVTLLVAVLLVTGFLVNQSPRETTAATIPATLIATTEPIAFTGDLDGAMVHGQITPGATGDNTLTILLMAADGSPIVPIEDPEVQLTLPAQDIGPLTTTLAPDLADGQYAGTISFPMAGEWEIRIIVRVSKFAEPISRVTIVVP